MRVKLTQEFVDNAKAGSEREREVFWDTGTQSFGLVVTASGSRAYCVQYRIDGQSRRYTIKATQPLKKAKNEAKALLGRVAKGDDPLAQKRKIKVEAAKARLSAANTLRAVAEKYLKSEERKGELRSIRERRRIFEHDIYPALGSKQIDQIKRSQIADFLDDIEDKAGAPMADHVLAVLRRLLNWHATRSDDFRSPLTHGMSKTKPRDRARDRVLSDDELRVVWRAADAFPGPYGHLVRFILLTATRLKESAEMRRQEVTGDAWLIPAARHKSKREFLLPPSKTARDLLGRIPVIGTKGVVFTTDGKRPIAGFSKFKRKFDADVIALMRERDPQAKPLPRWTTHDLRRTARSLMSRAGVSPDHAERALGHVIAGVRGTYDRYAFEQEKAVAFEALATLLKRIVEPTPNVVRLRDAG